MTWLRKRYLFLVTAVSLIAVLVFSSMALAGHRVQDEGKGTFALDSTDNAPEQATGIAKFTLSDDSDGFHRVEMKLNVRNLPEKAGKVWVAWLRDNETGYDEALGAFQTDNDGDDKLSESRRLVHFAEFDEILVSAEPKHDEDPTISKPEEDTVYLRGDLH